MDKAEFKQLFDTYFDSLRSYLYFRIADADVASDLAQDVFMKLWEKRDILTEVNIKALLYKMGNDMAISYCRKVSTRLDFSLQMNRDETTLSPQDELQFEELKQRYADALAEMPTPQRETFLMSREESLKYQEIAERLEISVKTVEKRMSAALQLLKAKLL